MQQQTLQQQAMSNEQQIAQMAFNKMLEQAIAIKAEYDPNANLRTVDFDQHTDRTYFVTLEGSLNDFALGTVQPIWKAKPGQEHIYQRIAGYDGKMPIYGGDLTKGICLEMILEEVTSNFPVPIGAIITNIEGKEYDKDGKNYAFIATKHCDKSPNKSIFEQVKGISRAMLEKYNDTSANQMESHCFRNVAGYTLVPNQSPLADMMRLNQEKFKMQIGIPKEAETYLKVATPIVDACIKRYEQDQDVTFMDMNNFNVQFERVGAEWNDPTGVIDNLRNAASGKQMHASNQRLTNKYTLTAKINMKLVCYGEEKK